MDKHLPDLWGRGTQREWKEIMQIEMAKGALEAIRKAPICSR